MREWLDNRLSVLCGPMTFGLPYHFAKIDYTNDGWRGTVRARQNSLVYRAEKSVNDFALSEFLLERYTALTQSGLTRRFFRIWHEPWRQVSADVEIISDDLIATSGDWWKSARLVAANYSPGVDVWMGWPHRVDKIL